MGSYWCGSISKRKKAKIQKAASKVEAKPVDDEDVLHEEQTIEEEQYLPGTVIILRNLVKIFGRGKKQFVAVKGVSKKKIEGDMKTIVMTE